MHGHDGRGHSDRGSGADVVHVSARLARPDLEPHCLPVESRLEPLHQQMISDFGVNLDDGRSQLSLEKIDDNRKCWRVIMSEGRNRQIRRTFASLGYKVTDLHRTNFGKFSLGDLAIGHWQELENMI